MMQGRWHPARTLNLVIDLRSGPGFVGVMDWKKRSLQSLVQRPDLPISKVLYLSFTSTCLLSHPQSVLHKNQ